MPGDAPFLLKDLIQGDESVASDERFEGLTRNELIGAFQTLIGNPNLSASQRNQLLSDTWRVHYRIKPPSIEEFLSSDWIGQMSESVWPHARKLLTEYWAPNSPHRHLILGSAIGTGKSTISTLSTMFVFSRLWCMRDSKRFFGLATSTSIVYALISFSLEKAGQLLLQPFMQILLSSPKFHRVRMEEKLNSKQLEYPDKVCWTTSGKMGSIQFQGDTHITLASSPQKLLGLNMIGATLSEISFFVDQGYSPEYIWRIYQDSKGRVRSRFQDGQSLKYLSGTILDSSPNDMEASPIDKYIFSGEAKKDPLNYIFLGSQWEHLPDRFKEWQKTGKTFPVFRGSASEPPKLLRSEAEISQYDAGEIYNVPIDLRMAFEENVVKNVKDYCGWPGGSSDKLIRDSYVIEKMFTPRLRNIYGHIMAPSDKSSKGLIWMQVRDKFFTPCGNNRYELYRSSQELRYLHVDQSETGDATGISMVHPEITVDGDFVFVTDFTISITPGKGRINLQAIPEFLDDLHRLGGVKFGLITFDQYQSSTTIQLLKEKGYPVERLSVEPPNPYLVYISLINNGKIKVGRNIVLKNNIKSLQEVKTESGKKKIDHRIGKVVMEDDGNWEMSLMGLNAKDLSDSHCGAVWNCLHNFRDRARYMWKDEEIIYADNLPDSDEDVQRKQETYEELVQKDVSARLKAKYGLVTSVSLRKVGEHVSS